MSKAEELANELMDEATYDLHHETIRRVTEAAAELRRLAAIEKAIMDVEPVASMTVTMGEVTSMAPIAEMPEGTHPLYTLNGIKKP